MVSQVPAALVFPWHPAEAVEPHTRAGVGQEVQRAGGWLRGGRREIWLVRHSRCRV